MITRIWHGWTTPENAAGYETILSEETFQNIKNRNIIGFLGIELLKRNIEGEIEFITIMHFEHMDSVRAFAGHDYEKSVVPEKARKLLKRYDQKSQHYEVIFQGK
ncbi:MAG: hypothetical protein NVS9B7_19000 [Flavisolibacter sp.]